MKRLILPLPPSLNHSHINIQRGKRLMRVRSEATKNFMMDAGWIAKSWKNQTGWTIPDEGQKIAMRVWFFWPDKRRRDQDNPLKLLQDSLTDILWIDDRWVLPQVMDFSVDKSNPRVEITLEVMDDAQTHAR